MQAEHDALRGGNRDGDHDDDHDDDDGDHHEANANEEAEARMQAIERRLDEIDDFSLARA